MISSGSLISVNPRLAVVCKSGICIFLWGNRYSGEFSVCGGRRREIAKRFRRWNRRAKLCLAAAPQPTSCRNSMATKNSPDKRRDCLILLSSESDKVSYEINRNTDGNSEDDYFYYQMNRYIIVYTVT